MAITVAGAAGHTGVRRTTPTFPALCVMFLASGACGLVYQQLWLRQLSLVFGVTVHAVSTVLAAFFGGLALGSLLAGLLSRRTRYPLRWYGIAEIVVGGLALATTSLLAVVEDIYLAVADGEPGSSPLLVVTRFALSFAVLLVPSTLLGATLPLVVSSVAVRGTRAGERIGVLYATNTAGAIAGAVAAGFWMIGSLGISVSFRLAAAVNIAVGIAAILCSWRVEPGDAAPATETSHDATATLADALPARHQLVLLGVFAISGFVSIALEVAWFRVLVIYVDGNTYAFTVMLAAVLGGIAIGGYIAAAIVHRWGARLLHLVVLELGAGLFALLSLQFLSRTFSVDRRLGGPFDVLGDLRLVIVAGLLTVAPTAILLGVAFPIGVALWTAGADDGADTGRRVGLFYGTNVAAGIVGSLVGGFLLVPAIGTRATIVVLSAALLASGLALAALLPRPVGVRAGVGAASALLFVVAAVAALPDPYAAPLLFRYPGERVLWREEGAQTTVSIHEWGDGTRVMYLDGLHQANSSPGMVGGHRLIGTLGLAVHPDPQRALVVGLGGGVTAGAVSDDPDIDVDVVELSREVVKGAEWLASVNGDITNRPNVDIRVDDGRNFLLTTDDRYDIVTADLILPHHAGAGKLWSVEYWELAKDALAPGGVMVQWVPADRALDHSLIVRSFTDVFPYVTAWAGGSMLVGSNEPLVIDPATYERRLAEPGVGNALAVVGLGNVEALRTMYTADRDELIAYAGDGRLLTDDRPLLEFWRSAGSGRNVPPDLSGLAGDPGEVIRAAR